MRLRREVHALVLAQRFEERHGNVLLWAGVEVVGRADDRAILVEDGDVATVGEVRARDGHVTAVGLLVVELERRGRLVGSVRRLLADGHDCVVGDGRVVHRVRTVLGPVGGEEVERLVAVGIEVRLRGQVGTLVQRFEEGYGDVLLRAGVEVVGRADHGTVLIEDGDVATVGEVRARDGHVRAVGLLVVEPERRGRLLGFGLGLFAHGERRQLAEVARLDAVDVRPVFEVRRVDVELDGLGLVGVQRPAGPFDHVTFESELDALNHRHVVRIGDIGRHRHRLTGFDAGRRGEIAHPERLIRTVARIRAVLCLRLRLCLRLFLYLCLLCIDRRQTGPRRRRDEGDDDEDAGDTCSCAHVSAMTIYRRRRQKLTR